MPVCFYCNSLTVMTNRQSDRQTNSQSFIPVRQTNETCLNSKKLSSFLQKKNYFYFSEIKTRDIFPITLLKA